MNAVRRAHRGAHARRAAWLILLFAVLTSTACTDGTPATPTPTPTPTPSTVPGLEVPFSGAAITVTEPDHIFAGHCDRVFTSQQLTALFGARLVPDFNVWDPARSDYFPIRQQSGLRCRWQTDDGDGPRLDATILPATVPMIGAQAESDCIGSSRGFTDLYSFCRMTVAQPGYWMSALVVADTSGDHDDGQRLTAQLSALFGFSARRAGLPAEVASPVEGAWSVDRCLDIVTDPGVSAATRQLDVYLYGGDAIPASGVTSGYEAAQKAAGYLACRWDTAYDLDVANTSFTLRILPGSAWAYPEVRRDLESVIVYSPELGDHAVVVMEKEANVINVFTARNWLVIQPADAKASPGPYLRIAAAVVRYLDDTTD